MTILESSLAKDDIQKEEVRRQSMVLASFKNAVPLSLCLLAGAVTFYTHIATGSKQSFYVDELFYDRYAFELAQWLTSSEPVKFTYLHPSGFSMLLAIVYAMYYAAGRLLGQFPDLASFLVHFGTNRSDFILLARLLSATFALATVPAVFALAQRLFSRKAATLASAAFVLCYPVIFYAHISANLTMLMFLTVTATYFIVRIGESGLTRDYAIAGLLIGTATGTKYYPILLTLPLVFAHVQRSGWRFAIVGRVERSKLFMSAGAILGATFLMFPLPVVEYSQWSHFVRDTYSFYTGGTFSENAYRLVLGEVPYFTATAAEPSSWWSNSLRSLSESTLFWISSGLMLSFLKFRRAFALLATPFVVMFTIQCVLGGLGLGVRQLYFSVPLLFVLSAGVVVHISDRFSSERRRRLFLVATGFVLLFQPSIWAVRFLVLLSGPTTVELGRTWLLENIPRGSVLLCDGSAAPFGETEDWWRETDRKTFSAGGRERLVQEARRNTAPFKVVGMKWKSAQQDCAAALAVGTPVYVVATDYFFFQYWDSQTLAQWGNMRLRVAGQMQKYVESLSREMEVVHTIEPRREEAFGPTVTIGRIDQWETR